MQIFSASVVEKIRYQKVKQSFFYIYRDQGSTQWFVQACIPGHAQLFQTLVFHRASCNLKCLPKPQGLYFVINVVFGITINSAQYFTNGFQFPPGILAASFSVYNYQVA